MDVVIHLYQQHNLRYGNDYQQEHSICTLAGN